MTDPTRLTELDTALSVHGLQRLGAAPDDTNGAILLIGPDEPQFWSIFQRSPEATDGRDNPLDRWSARVLDDIASQFNTTALYPFGGPPYHPFYSWAVASGAFWPSPIGFLVHAKVGLFASFRGALRWAELPPTTSHQRPCDTCSGRPCASACPVGAFADGYDVAACKAHLNAPAGADCLTSGCLARRACPVGQGRRLPAQSAFHMEAFR